jgi:hypothetical protein
MPQPPFSMYSSSQDQRDESLVDPTWLPSTAGPSVTDVAHPADPSALAASTAVPKSTTLNVSPHTLRAIFLLTLPGLVRRI